jgi:hypothetical protein
MKHYGTVWVITAGVEMRKRGQLHTCTEIDFEVSEVGKKIRNLRTQFDRETRKVQLEMK